MTVERSKGKGRRTVLVTLSVLAVIVLFIADIALGSVSVPLDQVIGALFGSGEAGPHHDIVWKVRIPEAITALLAGSGLAVCGLQMQSLFRNPLAGPSVLGITSGATLGVAILIMGASAFGLTGWLGSDWASLGIAAAALIGSMAVLGLILLVASRFTESVTILIVGLMIGFTISALVSVISYYSSQEQLQQFVFWGFGSFETVPMSRMSYFVPGVVAGLLLSVFLLKPLNALLLGNEYAKSMGVRVGRVRILVIICTGLLAGWITAFCGPIAFLGLAVPHITRNALRTTDHRLVYPLTVLVGGGLAILCAIIADLPGFDGSLPLNAVTSLIGAPVVIWIIIRQSKMYKAF